MNGLDKNDKGTENGDNHIPSSKNDSSSNEKDDVHENKHQQTDEGQKDQDHNYDSHSSENSYYHYYGQAKEFLAPMLLGMTFSISAVFLYARRQISGKFRKMFNFT